MCAACSASPATHHSRRGGHTRLRVHPRVELGDAVVGGQHRLGRATPSHKDVLRVQHVADLAVGAVELALETIAHGHAARVSFRAPRASLQEDALAAAPVRLGAHHRVQVALELGLKRAGGRLRPRRLVQRADAQVAHALLLGLGAELQLEQRVVARQHTRVGAVRPRRKAVVAARALVLVQPDQLAAHVLGHDELQLLNDLEDELVQREECVAASAQQRAALVLKLGAVQRALQQARQQAHKRLVLALPARLAVVALSLGRGLRGGARTAEPLE
mmetsp:Transcript_9278/g.28886  ORF Transcript_9278/g.28886 Transcript_9278/m.28886 type:complete len:275 (+) Transcript_9278:102-926(+)